MVYIYDILLNFCDNDFVYDFFEWSNDDDIENIKRIKLIHVSMNVFEELLNNECKIDSNFITKIYRTCEIYQSKRVKVLDYAFLVSDGSRVIALELNNNGNTIYKSKLLLDEEDEIAMIAGNLEITNLEYEKGKASLNNCFFTRKELIVRNYLYR